MKSFEPLSFFGLRHFLLLLGLLFTAVDACGQVPSAPTGVTASYSLVSADVTGFLIQWTDTSSNETNFEIWANTSNNYNTSTLISTEAANTTRTHLYLNSAFLPSGGSGYFWVVPLNASGRNHATPTASVTNNGSTTNNPPSGLSVTVPSTNTIRLNWTDNSVFEEYTEIWARDTGVGGSVPQFLGDVPWNLTQQDLFYYLQPGRTYELTLRTERRVGNYSNNSFAYTAYSSPVTFTMPGTLNTSPPTAPSNLSVAAFVDASNGNSNSFGVYFDDNSTDELGFEFQHKVLGASDTTYASLGVLNGAVGLNLGLGTPISGYAAASARDFRVRALRGNGPFAVASAFTPTVGATHASFNAPTDLRVTAPANDGKVQLFWADNATTETGYAIEFREGTSGAFTSLGTINSTDFSRYQSSGGIGGFDPGSTLQFQIRAVGSGAPSAYSNLATITIPAALSAPTGLTATVLGEGSVKLDWTDPTTNEGGFIIQARFLPSGSFFDTDVLVNSAPADFTATARTRTLTLPTTLLYPGVSYEFRVMAAFVPVTGSQINSPPSNVVTANVPFNAPTNFTATVSGESTVNFAWTDNSAVESKFYILAKESGATQYTVLASPAANATSLSVPNVIPGLSYDFAVVSVYVRAADDEIESALSNVVSRSLPFNAPTGLSAVAATDRQINLTWTDNSTAESGYIIYCKLSTDASFQPCGVVAPNVTTFSTKFLDAGAGTPLEPNTAYQFEVRAFAGLSLALAQSNPAFVNSNAVRTSATTGSVTTKDGVTADLSPTMVVNQAFSHTFAATQGQSSIASSSLTGALPAGVTYNSVTRILSGTPTARGSFTPTLTVNWSNGWSSTQTIHLRPYFQPGRPVVATPIAAHTLNVGDSPLSIPLASTFSDPDTESAVAISLPAANGTPGGRSITIILNDTVTPITVANFRSYLNNATDGYNGSIFHRLVQGFVLQGGAFRSSPLSGASSNSLVGVTKLAAIQNEPGLPNIAGTLAMAKQAGNPHSATTDFFFNLADNTSNLDFQNEGFSVFGRVAQPSLATLSALAALPLPPAAASNQPANYQVLINPVVVTSNTTSGSTTVVPASFASIVAGMGISGPGIPANTFVNSVNGTTNITISNAATANGTGVSLSYGESTPFSSMPYNAATAPAPPIDASKLVRINSVTSSVPVLSGHSATSSSTGVATASLSGTNLSLTPVAPGASTISLQVTDLDGNQLQVPLTFQVTVNNTLSNWATTEGLTSGQNGPTDDPDLDGRKNLLEYALMSSPGTANGSAEPALNTVTDGADKKATITFKVRKFAALTYTVEGSSNLTTWTPVWTSTSGFAVPAVSASVNNADHTLVTIKDSVPYSDTTPRFLQLKVTAP
jgi:cyclophilin family peptidyl-prolyl cis-trans isomerase